MKYKMTDKQGLKKRKREREIKKQRCNAEKKRKIERKKKI